MLSPNKKNWSYGAGWACQHAYYVRFARSGGTHHFECRQTDVRFRVSSDLPRYLRLLPLGENPGIRNR